MRAAVLSSASKTAGPLLAELLAHKNFVDGPDALPWVRELAFTVGAGNQAAEVNAALAAAGALKAKNHVRVQTELVLGLGDGLKRAGGRLPLSHPLAAKLLKLAEQTAQNEEAAPRIASRRCNC